MPQLKPQDFQTPHHPTWCPGCGNFGIFEALKESLSDLGLEPHQVVIVYGIGCAGNECNFINTYGFHSLHGRTLPVACGIKLSNHKLFVLAVAGDGDAYGEGLSHLIHTARANINLTFIVHNNQFYSLTTGQASPTTEEGQITKTTPWGEFKKPLNPLSLALVSGATFVARGFAGEKEHLKDLVTRAIKHKGFSLIDVFQPCVTFNKVNTYDFFREKIYKLEEHPYYDKENKTLALEWAQDTEKLPIGIFYEEQRETFEENLPQIKEKTLIEQQVLDINIEKLVEEFT